MGVLKRSTDGVLEALYLWGVHSGVSRWFHSLAVRTREENSNWSVLHLGTWNVRGLFRMWSWKLLVIPQPENVFALIKRPGLCLARNSEGGTFFHLGCRLVVILSSMQCVLFIIIIIIYPLTARVVEAPQMISQAVSFIFPCTPLPSGTWRTPAVQACPFSDVVFPPLPLSALSSSPFHSLSLAS